MWLKSILSISVIINLLLIAGLLFIVQSLGGVNYMWYKMTHRGAAGIYEHRKTMLELLPKQDSCIVFLGDSIIEGCEWNELFDNPKILNRGIPGDFTFGVLDRLPTITKLQAQQIFLMVGINDLILRNAESMLSNYEKILQEIEQQSSVSSVYIHSLLPVNNDLRRAGIKNELIVSVNEKIKALAKKYQSKYIDLHPLLKDSTGKLDAQYTSDGIHINGRGYALWKATLDKYIN